MRYVIIALLLAACGKESGTTTAAQCPSPYVREFLSTGCYCTHAEKPRFICGPETPPAPPVSSSNW